MTEPASNRHATPPASSTDPISAGGAMAARADLGAAWPYHHRWLKTVLAARGVDRSALEEVLQNVAMAASQSLDRLRDPLKMAPWLYRIAVLQAFNYRRKRGRQRRLLERFSEHRAAAHWQSEPDPLSWLLADEQRELVRNALNQLPRRDAEILLLKYTEDWSYRALADHLGLSESAIEARLHRARQRLRHALAKLSPTQKSEFGASPTPTPPSSGKKRDGVRRLNIFG